jgi:hypothetical protein
MRKGFYNTIQYKQYLRMSRRFSRVWESHLSFFPLHQIRVSSKQTKKFGSNRKKRNKICFSWISVCFVKPKTKHFGLFQFVSVFWTYIKTTETNRNVSKQTKTTLNFLKKYQNMLSINCFGCHLFVSVQSKHWNSLFRYSNKITEISCFKTNQNKPKQP